jgi:Asp-tRNA(Asn)/Glu-tRNA(Gln) amidotransferase A subunit family amidase
MEHSKTVLITFGTKHLKNNIMTKTQEIVKFILTAGIVVFGLVILSFGFRVILTAFLN